MDHKFVAAIMSGRFDAPLPKVDAAFDREREAGKSLLLTTEQGDDARDRILNEDPNYGVVRIGGSFQQENTILFRHAEWKLLDSYLVTLVDDGTPGAAGRQRFASYATVAVLQSEINGKILAVFQVHLPAHLNRRSKYWHPVNPHMWKVAVRKLAPAVRVVRKAHPRCAVMISGDPNARTNAGWTGALVSKVLAGFVTGRGDMFANALTKGLIRGLGKKVSARGSSDHDIRELTYTLRGAR